MTMTLADVGAEQILKKYFKNVTPAGGNNYTLKLFTNNVDPADTDTASTYTEAAGGGYAAKTLIAANFTVSSVGGIAQAAYEQQAFTFTGALTGTASVYGWFLVDGDGVLIAAQKGTAPITPNNNGDSIILTPVYQLSKGTPA